MVEAQITIINKLGLHARSASKLVSTSSRFSSSCDIVYKDKTVNAKSIMDLLMLAAKQGEQLTVRCSGNDEIKALEKILELIANRFDENE
jgi:phosphocarrier protein HPr